MYMNSDQSFKFDPFYLEKVSSGLVYQRVQQLKELIVGLDHNLFVLPGLHQCQFRVTRPDYLDTEKTDLRTVSCQLRNFLDMNIIGLF